MLKRLPREVSDEQIISELRSEKLAHLIWSPIIDKFDRTHDVEPTKVELEDYTRSMNAFMQRDWVRPEFLTYWRQTMR
jgi:hypothetical protein